MHMHTEILDQDELLQRGAGQVFRAALDRDSAQL
jgi:hypothetical protein